MAEGNRTPIEHPEALFDFTMATDRGESAVFVGRDAELDRLDRYLHQLQRQFALARTQPGDGSTVLFEGSPGVGKTALLAQFRRRAERGRRARNPT